MQTYITKRSQKTGQRAGNLMLPNASPNDSKMLKFGNVEFVVKFGNIFTPEFDKWIPVIPYFTGGILLDKLASMCDNYPITTEKYLLFSTGLSNIPMVILYSYDKNEQHFEIDFEEISKLCPDGSTLVFPTLGVNNGLTFHKSAYNIFTGIISCFKDENSAFHKLARVMIVTIYNQNQDDNSVRTIKHLFNLFNLYNETTNGKICCVCYFEKTDSILECGHFITCTKCSENIIHNNILCPVCRAQIKKFYPCHAIIDQKDYKCCDTSTPEKKQNKICTPCGHYKTVCNECEHTINETEKCPVCNELIFAYLDCFDS